MGGLPSVELLTPLLTPWGGKNKILGVMDRNVEAAGWSSFCSNAAIRDSHTCRLTDYQSSEAASLAGAFPPLPNFPTIVFHESLLLAC